MLRIVKQAKSLLILTAVLAVAVAACGSSGTPAPAGTNGPAKSGAPTLVAPSDDNGGNGGNGSGGFGDASSKFANVSSYKFSMVMAGGSFGDSLSALGGASADGSFTITGTVIAKPAKAADVTMGSFHIIEADGQSCIDMGTGSPICSAATGSSMADSFSPATMFGSMTGSSASAYKKVGTEQKNGVNADHYQGTEAAYSSLNSLAGVEDATWTADVWVATEGGYPVSTAIVGTSGGKAVFRFIFDISNVNDPSNKVTLPKS